MNPSAANEEYSDRTINRIIGASQKLGYDGWIVSNVYPERATYASELDEFNLELATENVRVIINFCLNMVLMRFGALGGIWGIHHYNEVKSYFCQLLSKMIFEYILLHH